MGCSQSNESCNRRTIVIEIGSNLRCEFFNQLYMPCEALSTFSTDDAESDKDERIKIRVCESADAMRHGLVNMECLVPLHRVDFSDPRIWSAQALAEPKSSLLECPSTRRYGVLNPCGKALRKHTTQLPFWICHSCWKAQTSDVYFQRGDNGCENGIGDPCYVCSKCFADSATDDSDSDQQQFIAKKLTNALELIRQHVATYSLQDDMLKYVMEAFKQYRLWLTQLKYSPFAQNEQYALIKDRFDALCGEILATNINKVCFCQRLLMKRDGATKNWTCHSCWDTQTDSVFYACHSSSMKLIFTSQSTAPTELRLQLELSSTPLVVKRTKPQTTFTQHTCCLADERCVYRNVSGAIFFVCAACYHLDDGAESTEDEDLLSEEKTFLCRKTAAVLNVINRKAMGFEERHRLKTHLFRVYTDLYQGFIAKLRQSDEVHSDESDAISSRFLSSYSLFLRNATERTDAHFLEWHDDSPFIDEKQDAASTSKMSAPRKALLNKVALKWHALQIELAAEVGVSVLEFEDAVCDGGVGAEHRCPAVRRLSFVMKMYAQYFLRSVFGADDAASDGEAVFAQSFVHSLKCYDAVAALNDFEHIKAEHAHKLPLAANCEYVERRQGVYAERERGCLSLWHKLRRRRWQTAEHDLNTSSSLEALEARLKDLELRQRHIVELTAKMHLFLQHGELAMDEKESEKAPKTKIRSLKWRPNNTPQSFSKFVNEAQVTQSVESQPAAAPRMEQLAELLLERGLTQKQHEALCAALSEHDYDSDAVVLDLLDAQRDPFNLGGTSLLFALLDRNPFFVKVARHHFLGLSDTNSDDDKLPPFTLGYCVWYYSSYFKDNNYPSNTPKFRSLKEECLNNAFFKLELKRFNELVYSAFVFSQSYKGRARKAMNRGGENSHYEIPANLPLSVSHVVVMLMYCNETKLQREYKKRGCREAKPIRIDEDPEFTVFQRNNREIGNWYRLFYEMVYFYGERPTESAVFYTGFNARLVFNDFAPEFMCPFSSTISQSKANEFTEGEGVIMRLECLPGSWDTYFNSEWLSDYDHERERVFFFVTQMKISNITYFRGAKVTSTTKYMSAFKLWSGLFRGHFVHFGMSANQKEKAHLTLLNLIQTYNQNNNIQSVGTEQKAIIPIYVQQLFYNVVRNCTERGIKKNLVIQSEYHLLSEGLKKELMGGDAKTLSPLLHSLCDANHPVFMHEFEWVLESGSLDELKQTAADQMIWSDTTFIYQGDNEQSVHFKMRVRRKPGGSESTGFGFNIEKINGRAPVSGQRSVMMEEVGWCDNAGPFNNLQEGGNVGIFAFKDILVADLERLSVKVAFHFCFY